MLHSAGFRIAVVPVFTPDGHRRARTFFGKKQGSFSGAVAAADDQGFLTDIGIRLDEAMMNFRQVFTRHIQTPRSGHRTNREEQTPRLVSRSGLLAERVKT